MDKGIFVICLVVLAATILGSLGGCGDGSRVAEVAREAADRQAKQNVEMAKLNREVAEGTKRLVEADAESRRELISLQQDLRGDQAHVNEGHDALETERKAIAARRHRDPIIANALTGVGLTLACLLPLVLCWYLLRTVHDEQNDAVVTEILIEELGSEHPTLLPPFAAEHTAIEHHDPSPKLLTVADDPEGDQEPAEQREETQNPSTKRTRRRRRNRREPHRSDRNSTERPDRDSGGVPSAES